MIIAILITNAKNKMTKLSYLFLQHQNTIIVIQNIFVAMEKETIITIKQAINVHPITVLSKQITSLSPRCL